jgi:hypothetical protein
MKSCECPQTMNVRIPTMLVIRVLAPSSAKAQSVLFSQPYNVIENYTSALGDQVYDDFTLSGGGTVNEVVWSGLYLPDYGYTISFWSDHSGSPGTLLVSDNISGSAGATFSGNYGLGNNPIYNYSATLAFPFVAAAGIEYYLSIVANSPGDWCWESSSVGNSGVLQFNGATLNPAPGSGAAFTLEGTEVPEPGTIVLGLFGTAAFLFCRRK